MVTPLMYWNGDKYSIFLSLKFTVSVWPLPLKVPENALFSLLPTIGDSSVSVMSFSITAFMLVLPLFTIMAKVSQSSSVLR